MGEGAGSYFDVRNWLRDKWAIPDEVLGKPGGRKVRIVVWVLWSFGGGSGQGYASIPTLAYIIGSSEATVRRALRLACDMKMLKAAGKYQHGTVIYEFPFVDRAVREIAAEAEHPTKRRVRVKEKTQAPVERVPVDETGLIPPAVDPSLPDYDWAQGIADQTRFFHVLDGRQSCLKQVLYALGQLRAHESLDERKAAIVSAFKANGIAKTLRKSWEILGIFAPTDDEVRRYEAEKREQVKDDARKRLRDAEQERLRKLREECAANPEAFTKPPEVTAALARLKQAAKSRTDPAQVATILKHVLGEPEEQDK